MSGAGFGGGANDGVKVYFFAYGNKKLRNDAHALNECCCFLFFDVTKLWKICLMLLKNYSAMRKWKSLPFLVKAIHVCVQRLALTTQN